MQQSSRFRKHRTVLQVLAFLLSFSLMSPTIAMAAVASDNLASGTKTEGSVSSGVSEDSATPSNASPSNSQYEQYDEDGFLLDNEVEPDLPPEMMAEPLNTTALRQPVKLTATEGVYEITLVGNGGTVFGEETCVYELSEGMSFWALPDPDTYPEGKYFTGWYTDPEATDRIKRDETPSGDMTLYAGWTEETVTVTFTTASGDLNIFYDEETYLYSASFYTVTVPKGGSAAYPDYDSSVKGTAIGIYYDKDCTEEFKFENAVTEDMTLYLEFFEPCSLYGDANGGKFDSGEEVITLQAIDDRDTYVNTVSLKTPEKDDSAFTGWFYDKECQQPVESDLYLSRELTLYAGWSEDYVTVTYVCSKTELKDENGKQSGQIEKKYAQETSVEEEQTPNPAGNFWKGGWYTDEEFTEYVMFPCTFEENTTLYLNVTPFANVTLNANGGTFDYYPSEDGTWNFQYSTDSPVNNLEKVSRDGYGLMGWSHTQYTEDVPQEPELLDLNEYIPEDGDKLFAVWTTDTVTVTFTTVSGDQNIFFDEETGSFSAPSYVATIGKGCKASQPDNSAPDGIIGWYTDRECTEEFDFENAVTENIELFTDIFRPCSLYGDANGGKFESGEEVITFQEIDCVDTYVDTENFETPKKEGAVFTGWFYDKECQKPVEPGLTLSRELTLYAGWNTDIVTVTFSAKRELLQDPDGNPVSELSVTVGKGGKVSMPSINYDGSFNSVKGWYLDEEYTEEFSFDDPVTENITVYLAVYEYVTVTFDANAEGAVFDSTGEVVRTEQYSLEFTPYINLDWREKPLRNDAVFTGWFYDPECTRKAEGSIAVSESVTFYAGWETENLVTVTLISRDNLLQDPVNGTQDLGSIEIKALRGTTANEIRLYNYVNASGRSLWSTNAEGTGELDFNDAINEDLTLYLTVQKPVGVKLDFNGGTGYAEKYGESFTFADDVYQIEEGVFEGENKSFRKDLPRYYFMNELLIGDLLLSREGYAFDQWYLNGAPLPDDLVVDKGTKAVTLTAQWTKGYAITLDLNGGDAESYGYPLSFQVKEGSNLPDIPMPEKDGERSTGWRLPDGKILTDTERFKPYEDTVLTAVWGDAAVNTVKVYLHKTDDSQEMYFHGEETDLAVLEVPADGTLWDADGYYDLEFDDIRCGWSLSETDSQMISISYYTFTEDTHLYLVYVDDLGIYIWEAPSEMTLLQKDDFRAEVHRGGDNELVWQYQLPGSSEWKRLKDDYASAVRKDEITYQEEDYRENQLRIRPDSADFDGMLLRAQLTDDEGKVRTSAILKLTLTETAAITKQPADTSAPAGTDAAFTVEVLGKAASYRWQYRNSENDSWTDAAGESAKTAAFKAPASESGIYKNGVQVRCLVTDTKGNVLASKAATLTVTKAVKPDEPDKPDTPVTPDKPDTPVTPVPETPDKPDKPDTPVPVPVTPDKPDTPDDSGSGSGGGNSGGGSGSGGSSGGGSSSGGSSGGGSGSGGSGSGPSGVSTAGGPGTTGNTAGGWTLDEIGWSYIKSDGTKARNEWLLIDGKWYVFNVDGHMVTGWRLDPQDGYWYYLDPETGAMMTGWVTIDGKQYYLNPEVSEPTWKQDENGKWHWTGTGRLPYGARLTSAYAPDGSYVNEHGEKQ